MPPVSFAKKAPSAVTTTAAIVEAIVTPAVGGAVEVAAPVVAAPTPPVAAVPQPPVATVPALVPPSGSQLPDRNKNLLLGDFIPEFSDIIWPRLNISQNIGELKDTFPPGCVVFNQAVLLFSPPKIKDGKITEAGTPPFNIVCLGFRPTRYVEKVPGGGRGQIVNSEEEVRNAGGTLDYNEHKLKEKDGMRKFDQLAEALIAIERPEHIADDDSVFVYPVEGKKYTLAIYGMKGMAFTSAAKGVFFTNRRMGCLRGGYPTRHFSFASRWKAVGVDHGSWIPVVTPMAATSPEFLAWVAQVLESPQTESTAAE